MIGTCCWVIADGYIPAWSHGPAPELTSHEAACILNAGELDAHVELTIYFTDREPIGPNRLTVSARRTLHQRFNELREPAAIPLGTPYAAVIVSDQPIVVQQTRLDSRQSANALVTTLAYASG